VLSKLLERLVARQLKEHYVVRRLSASTAIWVSTRSLDRNVLSGIMLAIDRGDLAALILLDLTAAFDTVDQDVLILPWIWISMDISMDISMCGYET